MTPKNGKYQVYGDPKPDGTYQIQKTLWDGTSIQVSQRVGDDERRWLWEKLAEMYALGYLNEAERDARAHLALRVVTREDVSKLVSDLPSDTGAWRAARKAPVDKMLLQEAIEAAAAEKSNLANNFPLSISALFIVLGMFGFLAGVIGLDAHTTTDLTVYAAMLTFMSLVSLLAGTLLARMT